MPKALEELRAYEAWRLDPWWVRNLTKRVFATATELAAIEKTITERP